MSLMELEMDPDVLSRLRNGDETAFNEVYDAFCSKIFGFLVRLSGRREIAEELLQETWLRLAARASRLNADTRIGPWLFTVARNLFLSYLRSRALQDDRTEELGALHSGLEAGPSPYSETALTELQERVEAALLKIPLAYREALLLVGIEGLTPSEAASICELRPEAFRKRLSRARLMLLDQLHKQPGTGTASRLQD
jgi:RNA polymerase sigma-70 factor (ECF subfamily)